MGWGFDDLLRGLAGIIFLSAIQGVPVSKFGGFSLVVPAQQSVAKVSVVDQFMKKKREVWGCRRLNQPALHRCWSKFRRPTVHFWYGTHSWRVLGQRDPAAACQVLGGHAIAVQSVSRLLSVVPPRSTSLKQTQFIQRGLISTHLKWWLCGAAAFGRADVASSGYRLCSLCDLYWHHTWSNSYPRLPQ